MNETSKRSDDNVLGAESSSVRRSSLDLPESELREFASRAQEFVIDYLTRVEDFPIFPKTSTVRNAFRTLTPLPKEGATIDEVIEDCLAIRDAGRHTGHPRFFGYVASSASPVGAIGDYIASALNQNLTAWRSAPGATDVARMVVGWLGDLIGYGADAGGLLTSGGSMANLNALYIAHRSKSPDQASLKGLWNSGMRMTIYASDQVHLSILKAADVLGLGREQVRLVKSDERFRLDVRDLRERLATDMREGLQPFCLVASAGTVNTGAVDPLLEVASIAREHDLWFHIDGAYGALGAVAERKRGLFEGLELADSVSLDPHKWLYVPIDCGCLLLRDPARARSAFSQTEADYIKVYEESEREAFAFWDYGMELTRRFRDLKVWMMLRYYGARRISAAISEDIELAEYLGKRIEEAEDFELLAPVQLSICCFRYLPPGSLEKLSSATEGKRTEINAELDRLNERLMFAVQRSGRAYVSNAILRGRYALRACIVNFRTTRADIDMTLEIIREMGLELESKVNRSEQG
jgi:aromatic-L-amino-acid/L-tryptophan decarboxylase